MDDELAHRGRPLSRRQACAVLAGLFGGLPLATRLAAQVVPSDDDLKSPAFTAAEMQRADIEAMIARRQKLKLTGKKLNGLDLSGLDFTGADFRGAHLNKTKFAGARLKGVTFDHAIAMEADFTGADLTQSSLYSVLMQKTLFDAADLSYARIAGDFSDARLRKTLVVGADLAAERAPKPADIDHAIFRKADLRGADFESAIMTRADLGFAQCAGTNFMDADLSKADAVKADFRGAIFGNTTVVDCDVSGTIIEPSQMPVFAEAAHLDRIVIK
jgi:uncharacterized protein YjbI with pentapeptide repeats